MGQRRAEAEQGFRIRPEHDSAASPFWPGRPEPSPTRSCAVLRDVNLYALFRLREIAAGLVCVTWESCVFDWKK